MTTSWVYLFCFYDLLQGLPRSKIKGKYASTWATDLFYRPPLDTLADEDMSSRIASSRTDYILVGR